MTATGYVKKLLGEQERVLFVTRQHWLVLAGEIASESVLSAAWVFMVSLLWQLWLHDARVALAYLLLIVPLASIGRDAALWANRQYIITNRRVIHVQGVLQKEVTDSSLEKVNDVKMEQSALGRVLDFGDVEILTASELGVNAFKRIGHPIAFKTAMLNAKEKLEWGENGGRRAAAPAQPTIPDLIAQLDQLRRAGVVTDAEFQEKKAELMKKL